jgi:hypothetical protein
MLGFHATGRGSLDSIPYAEKQSFAPLATRIMHCGARQPLGDNRSPSRKLTEC